MSDEVDAATLAWVDRLHSAIDELTAPVVAAHGAALACREGCSGCCSDGLTVFQVEAALIAARHGELLASGEAHAEGGCAFLDPRGACRIYAERPYVCRTQGLPLRWLDEDEEGETYEARDVCPLNAGVGPLEELESASMWTIGPIEQRLAERQAAVDGGLGRRIALRDLFSRSAGDRRRLPVIE
ncbi:MAG: YkgJ family cysteine cluster protein [Deltaproteobacteria bacterium]|nr:YkgJ family cysteine cluster protein [Deltaproteobacteria bacterium]